MGNGLISCNGCNDACCWRTHVEINNNLYGHYSNIKLDKSKSQQRIITNIFIPNCKLEISPDNSALNNKGKNKMTNYSLPKRKIQSEKYINKNSNNQKNETKNNFTQLFNEAINVDKNLTLINPSVTLSSTIIKENNNYKQISNTYNIEMLNYLNKVRKNPKSIFEDIDNIIKKNIKIIDNKEFIVSDKTKEIIKVSISFDKIKESLNIQDSVNSLKLNNKLKFKNIVDNIELTDNKINDMIINKKREIINDFPECFFYPTFIKDIKINIIFLLANNNIKEKIYYKGFSYFYSSSFNEKTNRFFTILCLA